MNKKERNQIKSKEKVDESDIMKEGVLVNQCTKSLNSLRCLRRKMRTQQIKWLWKVADIFQRCEKRKQCKLN